MRYLIKSIGLTFLLMSSLLNGLSAQQGNDLLQKAQLAYNQEKYDQTIDHLSNRSESKHYEAHKLLADAYQKKQQYEKAISEYNLAAKQNTWDAELFINRASARIWTENYDDALKDLERAMEIDKENYRAYYYLGVAQYYRFKLKPAADALEKCIKLNPAYAPAYYLLAATLAERNQTKAAVENYERAHELDTTLHKAQLNIAVLKYQNEDYYGAREDLTELLNEDADNADIYYYRAECSHYLNDKQAACDDYFEAQKRGDELSAEIYDKYCLKNKNRKQLPKRKSESISL